MDASATPPTPPSQRRFLPVALGLLALVLVAPLAWYVWSAIVRPAPLHGMELEGNRPLPEIELTGAQGQPMRLSELRGKLVVLYFGYTYCPDACPTTLAKLAQARAQLGEPAKDVQVLMVTTDPERDTPEILEHYVTRFDPTFVGLTGRPAEINAAAAAFGVYFRKNSGAVSSGYLVDHTAASMVVDRAGHLRVIWSPDIETAQMAGDLKTLLAR